MQSHIRFRVLLAMMLAFSIFSVLPNAYMRTSAKSSPKKMSHQNMMSMSGDHQAMKKMDHDMMSMDMSLISQPSPAVKEIGNFITGSWMDKKDSGATAFDPLGRETKSSSKAALRPPFRPAQTVDVTVGPGNTFTFSPANVTIQVGDTVRWVWAYPGHSVVSGAQCQEDNKFCSSTDTNCSNPAVLGAGATYSHTFNSPGSFPYFCSIHCDFNMVGQVTVQGSAGGGSTFQFSQATYSVNEGSGSVNITVTRAGDTSGAATVDFTTADGSAQQRTDYTLTGGTLSFAAGDTSKTFSVLITDDLLVEGQESIGLTLSNPTSGATLGTQTSATLNITDNDTNAPTTNPLDDANYFVRQHYLDFLNREADPGGQGFWTAQITACGSDQTCIRNKRVDVSNAFFFELEYQQTGSYVFRLYRAAFGNNQPFPNPDTSNLTEAKKLPSYAVFSQDRARVVGGSSLAQSQLDLANAFVQRPQFLAKYPASLDLPSFVDAVLATIKNDIGVDLTSQRAALISLGSRGAVIYRLADDNTQTNPINNRAFVDAEYNRAFVATQYFGYLRRDADIGGFLFWLTQVNRFPIRDVGAQHAMVCSFITSQEYQERFSTISTHNNGECPQ